jgi:hypothetical protein
MIYRQTRLGVVAAPLACLVLSVCAAPTTEVRWAKAGTDDATVSRELQDCTAQANAAFTKERGINQDISATLGGNWQFSGTAPIEQQSMRAQAAGYADQVLNSCMRAKGFTKEG